MVWDTAAERAEFREWERERRAYWRAHPEPVDRRPGVYGLPAWEGPSSPQSPIWLGPPGYQLPASSSSSSRAWAPSSPAAAALVTIGRIRHAA